LIVFLLSGLWHGASWNFIIWGGIHGVIVVIEKIMKRDREIKNHFFRITRIFFTFIIIVFTMLPFRATNFNQLKALTIKLFDFKFYDLYIAIAEVMHTPGMVGLVVLFFTDLILARYSILGLNKFHWSIKITWLTLITVLIFLLGDSASESFLYFQF
jgi:D-alanyl-lipoteichoic acid acyltransferase DltB (MBOAT superfamily)